MFKYLLKRAILIRVLVVFIFAFVCVELIQSYHFQILAIFKSVERRNVNDVREGPDQHESGFKLALVNFKGFFDKSADYDVAMIDRKALPDCPNTFEALYKGRENSKNAINKTEIDLSVLEQLLLKNYTLEIGGRWTPKDCQPKYKIAIIIPYRDREDNLKLFLLNMHPFFANQKIQYGIYLIEPLKDLPFNRGLLMNIGYLEALKDSFYLWDCFFFHDVDMIPEDLKNLYSCDPNIPKHYAVAVSKWKYRTNGYFSKYYGGINAYTRDQFVQINGFSNSYFGWGGEDDDLRHRTIAVFKKFTKESAKTNRYFMNPHKSQKANPNRTKTLESRARTYTKGEITEGLTTVKYNVKRIEKTLLFTRIVVNHPSKEFS